jgi:hypothetical protein
MFDFLKVTGIAGAIGICIVFVVVFLIAEPGKEISFWGIKFQKRYKGISLRHLKRLPKVLPEGWVIILQAYKNYDDHHIHEDKLFHETQRLAEYSELHTRELCSEMASYSLVRQVGNYVALENRALPLIKSIEPEK